MSERRSYGDLSVVDIESIRAGEPTPREVQSLCNMALRTLDAEQRAESAEAELARQREEARQAILAERQVEREERDQARQEAARLREALRKLSFAAQTTGGTAGRDGGLVEAISEAEEALQSAPPASESDTTESANPTRPDGGRFRTDPAPADSPEPSEALEALMRVRDWAWRGLGGKDANHQELAYLDADKETIRQALSQPAPAVPDASWVNRKTKEFRESAGELRDLGDADSAELLEGLADDMERARAYSAQGVPDVYTHVATIQTSDPFDERDGIWLSWENRKEAEKLPPGTKLFAAAPTPTNDGENDARDERTR